MVDRSNLQKEAKSKEEGRRKKEEGRRKEEEGRMPFGFAQGEKKEESPSASLRVKRMKAQQGLTRIHG
ncbi:MAG: hypothetical protein ABI180_17250 [Microcoleus sp.]